MISKVVESSQVSEARRVVDTVARHCGIAERRRADISLVVTELATNLVKHGRGGEILAAEFEDCDGSGLEVLAIDKGPGMADIERCVADGYSTAGSPGNGLGAIIRQSDLVRIYSRPDRGTAIMTRFVMQPAKPGPAMQVGAAVAPYPGEIACGDRWACSNGAADRTLLMADGSGHGSEAARAAEAAVRVLRDNVMDPCEQLVERMHHALRPTRGAAVAVARIDAAAQQVRYVGVGNITGALVSKGSARQMMSYNGTAGHIAPRIREMTYPFSGDPLLIMHSDGLTPRWDLAAYPGLAAQHPSLIAAVLFRDFRRGRDDASVVAMRALM
jgi:anti-sigma regulatory factor (Ser/Thr protein kinase)